MKRTERKRILLIEDEFHIAEGLRLNLELQGYDVEIAPDGGEGLRQWKSWRPDLVVLDIMLPLIDGLSVLQSIRLEDERLPVLILSARDGAEDKIKGLGLGVDDYLTKPFHLEEFLLRVERLLKRASWSERGPGDGKMESASPQVTFGGNRVDLGTGMAECRMGMIQLTEQEVKLLKLFFANKGRPLSRRQILEVGWGYTGETATRTVDNFVVRLRKYFEADPKRPVFFKSRRSVGYVFDPGPAVS